MTTKLDKLLHKEAQLKAQIQQVKSREKTLERKRDTRRKILVGAAVMARVERGDWPEGDLKMMMDGFLTRESERDLFDLDGEEIKEIEKPEKVEVSGQKQSAKAKKKVGRAPVAAGTDFDNHFKL